MTAMGNLPEVVSQEEWFAARRELTRTTSEDYSSSSSTGRTSSTRSAIESTTRVGR